MQIIISCVICCTIFLFRFLVFLPCDDRRMGCTPMDSSIYGGYKVITGNEEVKWATNACLILGTTDYK